MERQIPRRSFLQTSAMAAGTLAISDLSSIGNAFASPPGNAQVFFTKDISADGLLNIYSKISQEISGKVAIKLHTGEPHGPNILPREMVKALQQHIPNSGLVETNTLYKGKRYTTVDHRETIKINGWDFCPVDIMDEDGAVMIPVNGGTHFKEMSVGKNMLNYDSMVVLTHFKGYPDRRMVRERRKNLVGPVGIPARQRLQARTQLTCRKLGSIGGAAFAPECRRPSSRKARPSIRSVPLSMRRGSVRRRFC